MPAIIVVGAQWGDEGKSKIVDLLTCHAKHLVRSQGGNNPGCSRFIAGQERRLSLVPPSLLNLNAHCYLGSGCAIDPKILIAELQLFIKEGIDIEKKISISETAHVIFPFHRLIDESLEKQRKEGCICITGKEIDPCYVDKFNRIGIRMGEFIRPQLFAEALKRTLFFKNEELEKLHGEKKMFFEEIFNEYVSYAKILAPFVKKIETDVAVAINRGENVLFEASQGNFLDISMSTYPYVTASLTTAAGILAAVGIGPTLIHHTLGVVKAYTTRVGNGPFLTEVFNNEICEKEDVSDEEQLPGRQHRKGWFDVVLVKESIRLNGLDSIAITKLDGLDNLNEIKVCVGYEVRGKKVEILPSVFEDYHDIQPIYEIFPGWKEPLNDFSSYDELPIAAKHYLHSIESLLGIPISLISFGPEKKSSFMMRNLFSTT